MCAFGPPPNEISIARWQRSLVPSAVGHCRATPPNSLVGSTATSRPAAISTRRPRACSSAPTAQKATGSASTKKAKQDDRLQNLTRLVSRRRAAPTRPDPCPDVVPCWNATLGHGLDTRLRVVAKSANAAAHLAFQRARQLEAVLPFELAAAAEKTADCGFDAVGHAARAHRLQQMTVELWPMLLDEIVAANAGLGRQPPNPGPEMGMDGGQTFLARLHRRPGVLGVLEKQVLDHRRTAEH